MRPPTRALRSLLAGSLALALTLPLTLPTSALAGQPWFFAPEEEAITPESAADLRLTVEMEAKRMIDVGQLQEAADHYSLRGVEYKDPVLIIEAAETLRELAKRDRSTDAASQAIARIAPALDMLYFLRDGSTSASWQPVSSQHIDTLIGRAERVIEEAEQLITEIEDEQRRAAEAAAAAEAEQGKKQRGKLAPGTVLIIGGAVALGVGAGGGVMGAVGLVRGNQAQQLVENPLVYEEQHRQAEQQGRTANVLAGVGFALAGVGVIAGATLIVLGVRKRKGAGPKDKTDKAEKDDEAELSIAPLWLRGGGGLGIAGRF